ncbi:MAG: mechanosensitive ion channel family protein [Treponema sp.]|jgi:small-conductance mechanosensitive channel|nr:mechanosensitive ion channel family protein [Treponema sp.]
MDTTFITNIISDIFQMHNADPLALLGRVIAFILTIFFIIVAFNVIQIIVGKVIKGRISDQQTFMMRKGIKYTGMVMAVLFVFKTLGIDTSAILGAAGVAGIAFGFAAQTSMSSFISGIFLLSEKPCQVGDAIKVGDVSGVVLSIDLLSVKLRTYDNLFIRIPNETILKSNLTTITRFPIRRLDLLLSVAYKEDLEQVREVLMDLVSKNLYCLKNPAPFFGFDKFDNSGISLVFNVWFEKSNFWNLKTSLLMAIKKEFEAQHIEIPYPKIDINISNGVTGMDTTGMHEEQV